MDIREKRAYEVSDAVQANLDEINRRYRRLKIEMAVMFGTAALVLVLIAWGASLWM